MERIHSFLWLIAIPLVIFTTFSLLFIYWWILKLLPYLVSYCSVAKLHPILCDSMNCSMPGFPVLQNYPKFAQTHVHWAGDAIQPSHPLSSSPPALSLSQHQGLFQWVGFSHQVTKVLEFQLQHQSFQWIFRTNFLRIDWFDLLAVQGTLKSLLQHHSSKASSTLSFIYSPTLTSIHDYWKNHSLD